MTTDGMRHLTKIVAEYVNQKAPCLNETYRWKIPEVPLWVKFQVGSGSRYDENLRLRSALQRQWAVSHLEERIELATWYVSRWGGVKRNAESTIRQYVEKKCPDVASNGRKGIASWSKILVLRDPSSFLIFDARVAAALNALQLIDGREVELFPLLSSQNKTIKKFNLANRSPRSSQRTIPDMDFYSRYLEICDAAKRKNGTAEEVEMTLFANANALAELALKRI